ncbi:MAG: hypothetical protein QOK65_05960 [Nitrososphaeraceae archaeon]|nr:hypothetical protein [Nitrososphaeraceae archaeon]MDW0207972.1 hypothetical protein [Nitrososphaeraceae archaeon]
MFDNTCRYRLSVYVLVLQLALLGITLSLVSNAAGDSDELKQQSMEAFKQFNAMSEDQRNSAIKNMSNTDINMVMMGAAQINNEVNETIQAMAPPDTDMSSIYEIRSGNFTDSRNISKVSGISRILSVNNIEFLRFEHFNITNGPELHVYFTNKGDLVNSKDLGILKGNIGPQNYFLGNIADQYDTLVIASKPFKMVYAKAMLEP